MGLTFRDLSGPNLLCHERFNPFSAFCHLRYSHVYIMVRTCAAFPSLPTFHFHLPIANRSFSSDSPHIYQTISLGKNDICF